MLGTSRRITDLITEKKHPAKIELPNTLRLEKIINLIIDGEDQRPSPEDEERVISKMMERLDLQTWPKTSLGVVTRAAGYIFSEKNSNRRDLARLRQFYYDEVSISKRQGFLNPLMRIYLETFQIDSEHTANLAASLKTAAAAIGDRWQPVIQNISSLFDQQKVALEICAKMLAAASPWHELQQLGFRNPHAPGLMDVVHSEFVKAVGPKLVNLDEIHRLLNWLNPEPGKIRKTGAALAINQLLRSWKSKVPSDAIKNILIDEITRLYGHPKVDRNAVWNSVEPELEALLLKWLTGADLKFMLDVLTEANEGHMWAPRHEFWLTLYMQGRIDEAWVAFNDLGVKVALSKFDGEENPIGKRFGMQQSRIGDDAQKSLLIMRIGRKIIVEGTWNFKVHIFNADDPAAPKLYETRYNAERIRFLKGSESKTHLGETWKQWVRDRI